MSEVELDPRNAMAHCNLGVVLGDHEASHFQEGNLEKCHDDPR